MAFYYKVTLPEPFSIVLELFSQAEDLLVGTTHLRLQARDFAAHLRNLSCGTAGAARHMRPHHIADREVSDMFRELPHHSRASCREALPGIANVHGHVTPC